MVYCQQTARLCHEALMSIKYFEINILTLLSHLFLCLCQGYRVFESIILLHHFFIYQPAY